MAEVGAEVGAEAQPLIAARRALERGEYGQVLRLLEPLSEGTPVTTPLGGELRLLMATALFGQGQGDRALALCRSLKACSDSVLRAQARDLALVLEAPALQRPRDWSLTLPALQDAPPLQGSLSSGRRRRPLRRGVDEEDPPPPPVGPTRAPLGFAVVVLALLLLLTLLAGCVRLETSLEFAGPGRLRLSQQVQSASGQRLPWQRQLEQRLAGSPLRQIGAAAGLQQFVSPPLPAAEVASLWQRLAVEGAALAGLELPPPELVLQERNWLVGVHQRLLISLDLSALSGVPGLELDLRLAPLPLKAVRAASPQPAQQDGRGVRWQLQTGQRNRLEIRCWRWSPLGLGGVGIALLLALVLLLQRWRLVAGFGWPELPA